MNKLVLALSAAAIAVIATTAAALAVPASAKSAVNVRTGPSVNYNVVDTLSSGEQVNVTQCQSGWCYVEHNGPDGWVSGNYLEQNNAPTTPSSPSTPAVNFGITFGSGGISFSIGNTPTPPIPTPPAVCFYNGPNFSGASFCAPSGTQNHQLTGFWNDKISSIQVQPGATVQVCRNWNYSGYCQTLNSSAPIMNGFMNNQISSFKAF